MKLVTPSPSVLLITLLLGCVPIEAAVPDKTVQVPLTAFLVRHAEKVDSSRDPELSPEGKQRAAALAVVLVDAGIEYLHSSDYIRTRDTAAPLANASGLEVNLYDPSDLLGLADALRAKGGKHLVVGHSNTTPVLAELLGASPGAPIDEATEFDRLYVVTAGKDGTVQSSLLRYGP
jgi:broad specificity phosphatase PhoE